MNSKVRLSGCRMLHGFAVCGTLKYDIPC